MSKYTVRVSYNIEGLAEEAKLLIDKGFYSEAIKTLGLILHMILNEAQKQKEERRKRNNAMPTV